PAPRQGGRWRRGESSGGWEGLSRRRSVARGDEVLPARVDRHAPRHRRVADARRGAAWHRAREVAEARIEVAALHRPAVRRAEPPASLHPPHARSRVALWRAV